MLLEVLVAFAIAAMALALLYRGGIESLNGARLAERTQEAAARAQSRLAAMCHGAKLVNGTQSGDDGSGYTWRTEVARGEATFVERGSAENPKPPVPAALFTVRVSVSWAGLLRPHQVTLATDCLSLTLPAPS